jgi:phage N-6-adenine-methyltransferase
MTVPQQKPGKSKQDYQTPPELLRAIERDFSVREWYCDLAADFQNRIVTRFLGAGSEYGEDALAAAWPSEGDRWLNPPFANIEPWAAKCAANRNGGRTFLLVPASVGSNWYEKHVHGIAHVVALSPRLTFVGESTPYPKDIVLAVFGPIRGGFSTWRWKP